MNIIKEKKAAAQEALEVVRKENYKKKLELLDRFKALIEKANTEGASYNEFKTILQEWKEIKEAPADKANELGIAKLFNMIVLGGFLAVKPLVTPEMLHKGLEKSLPERHHHLIPMNEAALKKGMEIIK